MENNPFYICKDYHLFLFETRSDAEKHVLYGGTGIAYDASGGLVPSFAEAWWTRKLGVKVICIYPSTPIFMIKTEDKFWHVIIGEKVGWIITKDWHEIKPLERK